MKSFTALSSLTLALAVIFGAFGAHALKGILDPYSIEIYNKASFYHFIHGLGSLVVSLMPPLNLLTPRRAKQVCSLHLFGILLFSGSLYLLSISGQHWLGAITPMGGACFILGWLVLGVAANMPSCHVSTESCVNNGPL